MAVRERVYFWRYVLRSRSQLNAVSGRREFEGALLRIGDGYGCLHPWPELGDAPLEGLLEELRVQQHESLLVRQAVAMASMDERFRVRGQSVFDEIAEQIPDSHATIPECTGVSVAHAIARGFSVIKVKGHREFMVLLERMGEISRQWPHLRWRIDFNEVLTMEEVLNFVDQMPQRLRQCVDFLEDPCPWQEKDWARVKQGTGLDLALDRMAGEGEDGPDLLVLKPARCMPSAVPPREQRLVVTSAMDHPLGQCYAAYWAGMLASGGGKVEVCGLQTHELFEETVFSERLGRAGPRFQVPGGTGLGFDDLLEDLPWKRLS